MRRLIGFALFAFVMAILSNPPVFADQLIVSRHSLSSATALREVSVIEFKTLNAMEVKEALASYDMVSAPWDTALGSCSSVEDCRNAVDTACGLLNRGDKHVGAVEVSQNDAGDGTCEGTCGRGVSVHITCAK